MSKRKIERTIDQDNIFKLIESIEKIDQETEENSNFNIKAPYSNAKRPIPTTWEDSGIRYKLP